MGSTHRVGTMGAGTLATVDDRGTLAVGQHSLRLWAGCVDRWRQPERTPAVRQQLIDGMPVVRSTLRIPDGELAWDAFGFVPVGSPSPSVAWVARNDSPHPMAVALVIGGVATASFHGDSLVVDDLVIRLPRRPRRVLGAPDAAALFAVVTAEGPDLIDLDGFTGGWVAAVVPLSQAATLTAVICPQGDASSPFPVPPEVESVGRGWLRHLDRGVLLEAGDADVDAVWNQARAGLVLAPTEPPAAASAVTWAARARLGWTDGLGAAAEMLAFHRRRRGQIELDDPIDDSMAAMVVWSMLAALGAPVDEVDRYSPLVAGAAGWLVGPRGPALDAVDVRRGVSALQLAAAALAHAGDRRAAHDLMRAVHGLQVTIESRPRVDATSEGWQVIDLLDGIVGITPAGIELLRGWTPEQAGRDLEARGVPTPTGLVGFAIRWHGARPALLWETAGSASVALTAPALDPSWGEQCDRGRIAARSAGRCLGAVGRDLGRRARRRDLCRRRDRCRRQSRRSGRSRNLVRVTLSFGRCWSVTPRGCVPCATPRRGTSPAGSRRRTLA